jgi:hypothetical protein
MELRTPPLLIEVAEAHPAECRKYVPVRPLLVHAAAARTGELERALREEELAEREKDKRHWLPLRKELEELRHAK